MDGRLDVLDEGGAALVVGGRVAVQAADVVGLPSSAGHRGRVARSQPQPPGPPRRRAAAAVTACARGPTPCCRHLRARAHQPPPQLPVLNPVLRGVKQGGCERQASAGRLRVRRLGLDGVKKLHLQMSSCRHR